MMEDPITGILYRKGHYICPVCRKYRVHKVESGTGIYGYYCSSCQITFNKEKIESW